MGRTQSKPATTAKFLSSPWFEMVEGVRSTFESMMVPEGMENLHVDLTIESFDNVRHEFSLRGAPGGFRLSPGFSNAETAATMSMYVAYALFVEGDVDRAIQAFFEGDIAIDGDVGSLMALQGTLMAPSADQLQFLKEVNSRTAALEESGP